jgi:hypothetical protein
MPFVLSDLKSATSATMVATKSSLCSAWPS